MDARHQHLIRYKQNTIGTLVDLVRAILLHFNSNDTTNINMFRVMTKSSLTAFAYLREHEKYRLGDRKLERLGFMSSFCCCPNDIRLELVITIS